MLQYENEEERALLRRQAEPVTRVNRQVRRLIDDLLATMYAYEGVGLAAPQVGVLKRVIVVDVGDGPVVLVNPQAVRREGSEEAWEGCLSIPGLLGKVERHAGVQVTGLDASGRQVWVEAEGYLARALEHELDHLDGVLFLDRATRVVELPPETRLKIVYMGTPAFAVPVLRRLLEENFRVTAVVTRPDRPRGRGLRPQAPPVKRLADEYELRVLQPPSARSPEFVEALRELEPDVIITCAFGMILPPEVLAVPRLGCLNVHASLLPDLRGAAPIQRALMEGRTRTGLTLFFMDEGMDTGDILLQQEIPIEPGDTAGDLHDRLAAAAPEAVLEALRLLAREDDPPRHPQDHHRATYAPALKPGEEWIRWELAATRVVNHCRGLAPRPGASTLYHGRRLKILRARVVVGGQPGLEAAAPGTVVAVRPGEGFVVAAGEEAVQVEEVQLEGGRPLAAVDFLNGHPLEPGERLGGSPQEAAGAMHGKGGS